MGTFSQQERNEAQIVRKLGMPSEPGVISLIRIPKYQAKVLVGVCLKDGRSIGATSTNLIIIGIPRLANPRGKSQVVANLREMGRGEGLVGNSERSYTPVKFLIITDPKMEFANSRWEEN